VNRALQITVLQIAEAVAEAITGAAPSPPPLRMAQLRQAPQPLRSVRFVCLGLNFFSREKSKRMFPAGSSAFLVVALAVAFLLYFAIRDKLFPSLTENFEHPGRAPLEILPTSYSPPKTVAPSGPNPPAQAAPEGEVVLHADPAAHDPYAEHEEAPNAEPRITYPERSFRPAVPNDQVGLAVEAGIAGKTQRNNADNSQKFGVEMIQNSGQFYDGVSANDVESNVNFSAF
jgi:hypothetical protein